MTETSEMPIGTPILGFDSRDTIEALALRKESGINAYLAVPNPQDESTIREAFEKDEADILALIKGEVYQALYLKIGGEIVGMCVWDEMRADRNTIHYLYIKPDEQYDESKKNEDNNNYGSLLLNAALQTMGNDKDIYLITHSAQSFYENFEFKSTGKEIPDLGGIDIEMIRKRATNNSELAPVFSEVFRNNQHALEILDVIGGHARQEHQDDVMTAIQTETGARFASNSTPGVEYVAKITDEDGVIVLEVSEFADEITRIRSYSANNHNSIRRSGRFEWFRRANARHNTFLEKFADSVYLPIGTDDTPR